MEHDRFLGSFLTLRAVEFDVAHSHHHLFSGGVSANADPFDGFARVATRYRHVDSRRFLRRGGGNPPPSNTAFAAAMSEKALYSHSPSKCPPMTTSRFNSDGASGADAKSAATFVNGAVESSVTSPGCAWITRRMKSMADTSEDCPQCGHLASSSRQAQ